MPEYDVRTPLEQQWVDSPGRVREIVAAYMQTDGASLNRVTVILMPEGRGIGMGETLSPADFWDEP
jgi:hypothetical protein